MARFTVPRPRTADFVTRVDWLTRSLVAFNERTQVEASAFVIDTVGA